MDTLFESIGNSLVPVVAIICYTVYKVIEISGRPTKAEKYKELITLNELREKGIITQAEFDAKKSGLLD
jgi:Short C-terminal domain